MANNSEDRIHSGLRELMPQLSDEALKRATRRFSGMPFDLDDPTLAMIFVAKFLKDEGEGFAGVR